GDQLQGMRRAFSQPDESNVRAFPRGHDANFLDIDLTRDHVVSQPDHDLGQKLQALTLLVRDQDAQVLRRKLRHGYRNTRIAERSIRRPTTFVPSSIVSIAAAGTSRRRRPNRLKRTGSASGVRGDPPCTDRATRPTTR